MAALPFRFTGDEESLTKPANAAPSDGAAEAYAAAKAAPELTVRALVVGAGIGALLAAGNVYTSLKTTFVDGGALTATLLSFAIFATFRRFLRRPFGPLENNIAQTVSASAAVMSWVLGLMAPIPALELMGYHPGLWSIGFWGGTIALIGLMIALVLRRKLIDEDNLPFPSGTATAVLIEAIHADEQAAVRRARLMMLAGFVAAALTWFRDGKPSLLPAVVYLPIAIASIPASTLTLGCVLSPMMGAIGVIVGLRNALSLVGGGVVAWAVLVPVAHGLGWIPNLTYPDMTSWLVWPALGLLLSSTIMPGLLGLRGFLRMLRRSLRDAGTALRSKAPVKGLRAVAWVVALFSPITLATVGWLGFDCPPIYLLVAFVAALVLGGVSARAAGETDIAPVGSMGTLVQLISAAGGPLVSILSGAVVSGSSSATAQALWSFRAGKNLRASVSSQILAQVLGSAVGLAVVIPTYVIITRVYGLGSEQMPAVSAMSWKATSQALTGGLAAATSAGHMLSACIAFGVGAVFTVASRHKTLQRFAPSATAVGIGLLSPASLSVCAGIGAIAAVLIRRHLMKSRSSTNVGTPVDDIDGFLGALAAGALAGESILGVVVAILAATGIL